LFSFKTFESLWFNSLPQHYFFSILVRPFCE